MNIKPPAENEKEITTGTLEKILLNADDLDSLENYLAKLNGTVQYGSFIEYFRSLDKVKAFSDASLQRQSGIERTYCYHILNGSKTPGRDKIIRLCLAAGLDITQTRRCLEAGKVSGLHPKNRRDAVITFSLKNHLSVTDADLLLEEYQLEPLG